MAQRSIWAIRPPRRVLNLPIPIDGWVSERGYPNNYGGGGWTGVESMRRAMTKSHNYATAQALFEYVTIDNSVAYLKRLGVSDERIDATGFRPGAGLFGRYAAGNGGRLWRGGQFGRVSGALRLHGSALCR